MKSLSIILSAIGLCTVLLSNAQTPEPTPSVTVYKHHIGVAAGFTTGYGLSYRYMHSRWGVQATFAPLVSEDYAQISLGLSPIYRIIESQYSNLFFYQGNHFLYEKNTYEVWNENGQSSEPVTFEDYRYNAGIGLGIEILMLKRVSINLMAGYALYDMTELNMTGELGLYYRF